MFIFTITATLDIDRSWPDKTSRSLGKCDPVPLKDCDDDLPAVLEIEKAVNSDVFDIGDSIVFMITVANSGDAGRDYVSFNDLVKTGALYWLDECSR